MKTKLDNVYWRRAIWSIWYFWGSHEQSVYKKEEEKWGEYDIAEDKTNMQVLSIMSNKIDDDLKKGAINIKSFTGN